MAVLCEVVALRVPEVGVALALAALAGGAVYAARLLTARGAVAAGALGFGVLVTTGWTGAGALLTFFLTASLLGVFRRRLQGRRGAPRDEVQVAANGGVALAGAVLSAVSPYGLGLMFGALAAASADTWSTELGMLLGGRPRDIVTWRRTEPGANGAVSAVGLAASALGAAAVGAWFGTWEGLLAVTIAGVAGGLADSLVGATVQAKHRCVECGRVGEESGHCGRPCDRISGLRFINNNTVNFLATVTGGLIGMWML